MRRSVAESVRSHYTRRDLEGLFELQPASVLRLMDAMPTQKINTSLLVERETLASFLGSVEEKGVDATLAEWRRRRNQPSRRALRSLVRRDLPEVTLASLPDNIAIETGRVTFTFGRLDELVQSMFVFAQVLNDDLDELSRRYEPVRPSMDAEREEMRQLFNSLAQDEERHRTARPSTAHVARSRD